MAHRKVDADSETEQLREENLELRRLIDELSGPDREDADALKERCRALARSNAQAAELVAEVELKTKELEEKNSELARANVEAAELMAQLEIKSEELTRTNKEKNRLLGMISHDIGNGITMIGMSAEALTRILGHVEEQPERMLGMIRNNCKSLADLLSQCLDISRIHEGTLEVHFHSASVVEVVREIVSLFTLAAEGKRQRIALNIEADIPSAVMDRSMIHQVVTNLLSNAIKFSPEGGEIAVDVSSQGGFCTVEVSDSGPGLTEADREKLFGAFCRLSAQPTGGEKSHGLGLAICKRLIEIHHGTIGEKDRPGGGATFFFTIPLAQDA